MQNELSDRERAIIKKVRATKNPDREITYLTSCRDRLLQGGTQQPLFLPDPRAAS